MKRFGFLVLILVALILSGCAATASKSNTEPVEPGETIGVVLVTTGTAGDFTNLWDIDCEKQGDEEQYSCHSTVGTKVNISIGIYDDQHSGNVDQSWEDHTYELFIENRPVNLQSFGSVDIQHPVAGKMRLWNVVIIANKPGKITLRDKGVVDGEPIASTMIITFTAAK